MPKATAAEKQAQSVFEQIERSSSQKLVELRAAVATTAAALAEKRTLFEQKTNEHHLFLREAAQVHADRAVRELAEFEALTAQRGTDAFRSRLSRYVDAAAAANSDAFIAAIAPELDAIERAEASVREHVAVIAAKAAVANEAREVALRLAGELDLDVGPMELPPLHLGVARGALVQRRRAGETLESLANWF